ncbi:hypothetical protein [Paraburkholderia acidiphila]|uniref:Uncharacterized protein n=1 Tax=Paraburkholderia acidiphila TaxID=2571747 RepID=A0A7Z2JC83_9BURK|nr:hypothetical protein [Paraburkholderia acidiphila]QGZ58628.1 hypothetical protein FAZ97_26995 [Paraburkholderia acidiphila]
MAHDIEGLERDMKALQKMLVDLGGHKHFDEFMLSVRKPGFTTKRDEYFVRASISTLHKHVKFIAEQLDSLLAGTRLILEGSGSEDS